MMYDDRRFNDGRNGILQCPSSCPKRSSRHYGRHNDLIGGFYPPMYEEPESCFPYCHYNCEYFKPNDNSNDPFANVLDY